MATNQAKPNGQLFVPHGKEKEFLAPLSIKKIPMLGEKTCQKLYQYGIEKIGDLQKVNLKFLEAVFGRAGTYIYEKAHGIDHSEIIPHSDRKSISTENTFENDVTEQRTLETILVSMTEELAALLRTWRDQTPYPTDEDWVFASPNENGKWPYNPAAAMRHWVQSAAKTLGINKRIGWHTFRHSVASLLGQSGESVKVVQELLRHANSRITQDVYMQADQTAKRDALNRLSGLHLVPDKRTA